MKRVLIANRGEIAARILRACAADQLETVAVYSTADSEMPYLQRATRTVCIGPAPATQSYLNMNALIMAARGTGCDAIHPGYGFLAENAEFARLCEQAGLVFIGPRAESIETMGDKVAGRKMAQSLGLPVVPGSDGAVASLAQAQAIAAEVGFPLLIKASGGGGGRGMRVVQQAGELEQALAQASAEAGAAFGNSVVYLERYFERVHHVEVQVLGDGRGTAVHLGERECSVQRRHQKLVEESPAVVIDAQQRHALCEQAQLLASGMRYGSAGTVEFIVDPVSKEHFFIEMNTRIQVEHPVTEMVRNVDLVRAQLSVAKGEGIAPAWAGTSAKGHAIEWRINAEDSARNFLPTPGRITRFECPHLERARLDTFIEGEHNLVPYYDSLLGKLIVHGDDRADAIARSAELLNKFCVDGVPTTIDFFRELVLEPAFIDGQVHTRWLDQRMARESI